ncbi:hypothetical protein [Desulfosporosinus sp. SB140]|uniref:hypothetical protein n=1 Tax=Desulfosporosinus paludis TaxID=3115649 RepID=UPI00388F9A80
MATLRAYQDVITDHPERLKQALPAIGRQVHRMEKVISGLLQIATLDKGDITLESVDLGALIQRLEPVYEAESLRGMRGNVAVESKVGVGTQFTIQLPLTTNG